jgi:hypothetical protein
MARRLTAILGIGALLALVGAIQAPAGGEASPTLKIAGFDISWRRHAHATRRGA